MKILVPVKRVIDPYAKVKPLGDGSGIDTTSVKFDVNPFDEIAVEEAVRKKEANPAIEIVVVSIGGSECEEQLRKALAMGADRAILVQTDAALDPSVVAHELAEIVAAENPSLVLMGKQSTDGDNSQAGPALAAKLGWPHAAYAAKLELSADQATVTRETDAGEEVVKLPLPALVTTDLRLNEPRYIALPGIIKARSKPLETRPASGAKAARIRTTKVESVPARGQGIKVNSVDELVAALASKGVSV